MILETNDLIIRPSEWDDLEDFCRWEQLPEVTEFFSIRDGQTMEDVVRKFVTDDNNPQFKQFTILLKAEEGTEPIGRIVLGDIEEGWKAEIWRIYIADTTLRGKGYGKEAMQCMMKYCFEELALEILVVLLLVLLH